MVFRNFPLTRLHPEAENAAETAEFAGALGHFWEMHDALYENQDGLGLPLYLALAEAMNLPKAELSEALETRAFGPKVRSDFMGGLKSGVNGTPTFFVNGKRHDGSFELDDLVAAIDAELVTGQGIRLRRGAVQAIAGLRIKGCPPAHITGWRLIASEGALLVAVIHYVGMKG